ncbi:hypothetical protein LLH00_06400 [bacterium]|nr:hypothetical protein [bacterium]
MDEDFKLEWQEDGDEDDSGETKPSSSGNGGKKASSGHLTLLLVLLGTLVLGGGGAGFWWLRARQQEQERLAAAAAPKVVEEGHVSSARAMEIMENRKLMRDEFRSSHNTPLVEDQGQAGMVDMAVRGELTLVSGLFQHYVQTTAAFFELSRIITNNYVENRAQVEQLFLTQVKPAFDMAERRRDVLERRISHSPAQELYDNLAWIAHHDSLAVMSMQRFVEKGEPEDFLTAVDLANTAKLMLRKFWSFLREDLRRNKVVFTPPEGIWRRYYVAWDIVE